MNPDMVVELLLVVAWLAREVWWRYSSTVLRESLLRDVDKHPYKARSETALALFRAERLSQELTQQLYSPTTARAREIARQVRVLCTHKGGNAYPGDRYLESGKDQ